MKLTAATPNGGATSSRWSMAIDACMQVGLSRGEFVRLDEQEDDASRGDDDARFEHRKRSPWSAEVDGFSG